MRQIAWRHAGVFGVKKVQDCSTERGEEVEWGVAAKNKGQAGHLNWSWGEWWQNGMVL
jgi:hypothetical protein